MRSEDQCKKQIQQWADEAQDVAADAHLSPRQKKRQLEAINTKIHDARQEMKDLKRLRWEAAILNDPDVTTQELKNFNAEFGDVFKIGGTTGTGYIGQAPGILPSSEQTAELMQAIRGRKSFRCEIGTKDAGDAGSVSSMMPPQLAGMVPATHEPTRILNYMPIMQTQAPVIEYLQHTGTAGAAAMVAPGGLKPTVTPAFQRLEARARKIAAAAVANDEDLQDFGGLVNFLQFELQAVVVDTENQQILNGDGTGENLLGLLHQSGVLTRGTDTTPGATALDVLEEAFTDLRVGAAHTEPTLVVMHPATWSRVRRTKDAQGRYLVGDPLASAVASLWGVPVAVTTGIDPGTAFVADLSQYATAYVRSGMTLLAERQSDDLLHNRTTLVAEERLALACIRPAAGVIVTGLASDPAGK